MTTPTPKRARSGPSPRPWRRATDEPPRPILALARSAHRRAARDRLHERGRLKNDAGNLKLEIDRLRASEAYVYSPREFALAETHLDFFWEEYEEWDFWEAEDTLAIVRENVAKASSMTHHESDLDADGIIDLDDMCPEDPENFNRHMDEDGCPDAGTGVTNRSMPPRSRFSWRQEPTFEVRESVEFQEGSTRLTTSSMVALGGIVDQMALDPSLRATIEGHTDNVGPAESNRALSQRRADSVRTFLVGKGIDGTRVTANGYGEDRPIADNGTPEGRRRNRRVELILR